MSSIIRCLLRVIKAVRLTQLSGIVVQDLEFDVCWQLCTSIESNYGILKWRPNLYCSLLRGSNEAPRKATIMEEKKEEMGRGGGKRGRGGRGEGKMRRRL